jgi:cell division protein FtsZ
VIDENMDDEVQVTVIAAGFERWEGVSRSSGTGGDSGASVLGARGGSASVDIFADGEDDEIEIGDDDFDVPSFLR